jgi:hypothetical protein
MFVTSRGSALARFRRAVASGNATIALAAVAELPRPGVEEALALVLVGNRGGRPRSVGFR